MGNLTPTVITIGGVIIWVSISLLASHVGGWAELAKKYAVGLDEPGETYWLRSGFVGAVNYSLCLVIRVCVNGLRLAVLLPIRIGHPPLFIPWDQFHSVSEKRVLFFRFLEASIGIPVVADVELPLWIRDHLPTQQNYE